MVNKLSPWLFLSLAVLIMGAALAPIMRAALGIDESIQMSFLWVITLLIGGLMCGLTAMILLIRRPGVDESPYAEHDAQAWGRYASALHLSQLLIFTGIPLLNFLVCYGFWLRWRGASSFVDYQGREALNFQVSIYLYLLMCLFLAYLLVGLFFAFIVLLFAATTALVAAVWAWQGRLFAYPASIAIVARSAPPTLVKSAT